MADTKTKTQLIIYITAIVLLRTLHPAAVAAVAETGRHANGLLDCDAAVTTIEHQSGNESVPDQDQENNKGSVVIPTGMNTTKKRNALANSLQRDTQQEEYSTVDLPNTVE